MDWQAVRHDLDETERHLRERASRALADWPELLAERAQQMAGRAAEQFSATEAYLGCRLYQDEVLIPMPSLLAVQGGKDSVPLPQAPQGLRGICYYRGQLASVADLATLLGLAAAPDAGPGYLIFARSTPVLGLWVKELTELYWRSADEPVLPGHSPYLRGLSVQGQLLLDLPALAEHPLLNGHLQFIQAVPGETP
ncbi:MAG: chemotaxis protein CheW [Candidatus Sericytochromatia bacterium]